MKKKLLWASLAIVLGFLGWYFFIKESDYTITFTAKTSTGTVCQGAQDWNIAQAKFQGVEVKQLQKNNFNFLQYEWKKGGSSTIYSWHLTSVNDSLTKIEVGIKAPKSSFYNRLTAPFSATPFVTNQINIVKNFRLTLLDHLSNFKIELQDEVTTKPVYVAYITLQAVLQEKAQNMIFNDPVITTYLAQNKIKITGTPYLEITDWDLDKEQIVYNYCFPIAPGSPKVAHPQVKFKTIPAIKGLQATYYGNYRTSDRAWFQLLDKANNAGKAVQYKPLEHFFANPFNGGNEMEWKTVVVLPYQ
ncbi:MAG: hypothetical protein RIT03_1022 [Bacteroidota bacterium]|jgi:effector-binding domain-containing protein